MARVKTNDISLAYAIQEAEGTLGADPTWKLLEPNTISGYGNTIRTVAREPISKTRQRRKGTVVDLDSAVAFEHDITIEVFQDFIEGWVGAQANGYNPFHPAEVAAATDRYRIVDPDDLTAGIIDNMLVFARGFALDANNGLKVVNTLVASVAATGVLTLTPGTPPDIEDGDQVIIGGVYYEFESGAIDDGAGTVGSPYKVNIGGDDETSLDNLILAINATGVAGTDYSLSLVANPDVTAADTSATTVTVTAREKGSAGNAITTTVANTTDLAFGGATLSGGADAFIDVDESLSDETPADTLNATLEVAGFRGASADITMTSGGNLASTVLDFTTLGLTVGQFIKIGGADTITQFATAANNGYARIVTIAAALLTLDKRSATFVTDAGTGKTIDIYFGRFVRNVSVDDADYIERYFTFEAAYPNLIAAATDGYEYSRDNLANEVSLELPLTDKAVATFGFNGKATDDPTSTRETNAASPRVPVQTVPFNTSADIARLRVTEVDETGLTTDFKSLTLRLNNNVSPEKVLSILGARFLNQGIFMVDIESQCLFSNGDVIAAIRSNTTVTFDAIIRNDDGGLAIDIPSMVLGGGDKEYPVNETVLVNLTGGAFEDPTLHTSIGFTIFPYLPPAT